MIRMLGAHVSFAQHSAYGARRLLLALHRICLVGLDAANAATSELAVVNDAVRLRSQHALHIVLHVAQDNSVSLNSATTICGLLCESLDLETLQHRHREASLYLYWIGEDGTVRSCQLTQTEEPPKCKLCLGDLRQCAPRDVAARICHHEGKGVWYARRCVLRGRILRSVEVVKSSSQIHRFTDSPPCVLRAEDASGASACLMADLRRGKELT